LVDRTPMGFSARAGDIANGVLVPGVRKPTHLVTGLELADRMAA